MSRKNIIISVVAICFVVINIVLVVKDNSHRVERVTFISAWTETEQKEMRDLLPVEGVLDYAEEHFVYLDDSLGSFDEFLVKKGDTVKKGDSLYTYDVYNFYEMRVTLENRENELNESIKAVKKAIQEMEGKQIKQEAFRFVYPDDKEAGVFRQNVSDAVILKEQFIIEKEKELAQAEAELKSTEGQLADLNTGSDSITVESPYEGKVTDLKTSLENPLITIEDPELYVTGELLEKERMKVQQGMAADISLKENGQTFAGSVSGMDDTPKTLALSGESVYPFYIQFDMPEENEDGIYNGVEENGDGVNRTEEDEEERMDEASNDSSELAEDELLQGYHADVDIVLEEDPEATVLPQQVVVQDKVWWMTGDGTLRHVQVETGIAEGEDVAIHADMIDVGDWMALKPEAQFRDESTFITPFKPNHSNWKNIFSDGARKRSVLIGLLGR